MANPERRPAGFALIGVLWLLLLLGIIAGVLLAEARSERHQAATAAARLRAQLIADAAINRALLSLVSPQDPERWRLDGTPRTLHLFDHDIAVRVESEAGKIDLNAASAELLAALFRTQGLAPAEAEQLAERVVAWRTPPRPGLPDDTADPYHDAGRAYGPRQGPFRSVDELRLVLGMTDTLQQKVAPLVTVYARTPDVDRQVATDAVLGVLAATGDRLAETQRDARGRGQASGVDRAPAMGEALTIDSRLMDSNLTVRRSAVIRLTGDRREPYWVLSWR